MQNKKIDKLLINDALNSIYRIEDKLKKENITAALKDTDNVKQYLKFKRDIIN